jgi:hypothetical protein
MIRLSTLVQFDCLNSKCSEKGCDQFVCWNLEGVIDNQENPNLSRIIYHKERQQVLINLALSPVSGREALDEQDSSCPVLLTQHGITDMFVSLRWLISKRPPEAVLKQFTQLDAMITEIIAAKMPEEAKAYMNRKIIMESTQSVH